ncbi:DUF4129 domain-containing protein [Hamadaea tsunoensis]|uniref:DUF4129 domain-containing protein n=1 Tax=Hamadaea tsunoensis TaxID=53368 RepID=UPI00040B4C17|nr:DUF4129 domain-containing protein [Hamadaea tsunoensis]
MSRTWTEFVAMLSDLLSLPLLLLVLVAVTALVAALWYFFPAWIPRRGFWRRRARFPRWRLRRPRLRWPHWRRPRFRWPDLRFWRRRRRAAKSGPATVEEQIAELIASPDELPAVPAEIYLSLADRLAAEGRYAEALRERYRSAVRDLVQNGVVENRPGWTVAELAGAAATARPAVGVPLRAASGLFSEVWYAEHAATAEHDDRMRDYAHDVHERLVNR